LIACFGLDAECFTRTFDKARESETSFFFVYAV